MADFYEVLNVPRNAAAEEIKQAYHQAARRHHPDKKQQAVIATPVKEKTATKVEKRHHNSAAADAATSTGSAEQNPQQQEQSSLAFLRIQEAWECLGDAVKRIEYDRTLRQEQDSISRRIRNAIVLTSRDCRWEEETIGDISKEPKKDGQVDYHYDYYQHHHHDNAFYQCRCGYDLALSSLPVLHDDLIACPGCSLLYDTAPLFDTTRSGSPADGPVD